MNRYLMSAIGSFVDVLEADIGWTMLDQFKLLSLLYITAFSSQYLIFVLQLLSFVIFHRVKYISICST